MDVTRADVLERIATTTAAEVGRGLRAAFDPDLPADALFYRVRWENAAASITLTPIDDLRIGLIRLPRHHLHIAFEAGSGAERAALLDRMDRYLQRGGG